MHNAPQLRRLREQFPHELVVVGVHSAKFLAEQGTAGLREALGRIGITHPVVNDRAFGIWQHYAIRAWPSVVLVDPAGYIVYTQAGEILAEQLAPRIAQLIESWDARGLLDHTPLALHAEQPAVAPGLLRYPSRLLAHDGQLFVADTGHHKVHALRLAMGGLSATLARSFGSGQPALADGDADTASFQQPRGLALATVASRPTLYVADTGNHAVRAIDLGGGVVRTVAGTGQKAHGFIVPAAPRATALRSPWALLPLSDLLFIAMAGSHQLWTLRAEQELALFAGSGYEALFDGPRSEAAFNQPSDLALGKGVLFVADPEASAVRAVALDAQGGVTTLVGQGLFAFGDLDGTGDQALLQHPTGLAFAADAAVLYIADSYNHKVKLLAGAVPGVATLIGSGRAGAADGPFALAELAEPEGLALVGHLLYIADTNNHAIRVADLEARTLHTLALA